MRRDPRSAFIVAPVDRTFESRWRGSDHAQLMIRETQVLFPGFRRCSFDRRFHRPETGIRLNELVDHNVLPRKGVPVERRPTTCGQEVVLVAKRRPNPAIEPAIDILEHRGLDRVRAFGAGGFARLTAPSRQSAFPARRKAGTGTCVRTPATTVKYDENSRNPLSGTRFTPRNGAKPHVIQYRGLVNSWRSIAGDGDLGQPQVTVGCGVPHIEQLVISWACNVVRCTPSYQDASNRPRERLTRSVTHRPPRSSNE